MMCPPPRTTRLPKTRRLALACMLAFGFMAAPVATGGGLEDFYNSVSAYNNATGPQAYHGQAMNVYTGGSLFLRTPSRSYQLLNVAAPSLRGGCGGIDVFAGSFSFINDDQFVALLRNIGQNALGLVFMLALQSMAPDIMELIKYLQNVAKDINSLGINSCESAKALVAASGIERWMKANTINTGLAATVAGMYSDWSQARAKMFGDSTEASSKASSLKTSNQVVDEQLIEGNLVWRALNKGNLSSYLTEKERRMVMSAIGAVIVGKTQDGRPDPSFHEPVLSFKRLLGTINGSDNDSKPEIFKCLDNTTIDGCTQLGKEAFDGKPFSQLAYERMLSIYDKIVRRGPALSEGEIEFINATSVPVYKILATAASMKTQSVAEEQIIRNADVIGAELAAAFMLKALDEVESALHVRSQVGTSAEADVIKDLLERVRDKRRSIYSEKAVLTAKATGIYNLMAEMQALEKMLFGNLSEGVAANLRFAQSVRRR